MKKIVVLLMLLLAVTIPAYAGDKVVLATLDWEPYIGSAMKDNGYVAAVVKEAFKRSGIETEFQFNQWSRTVGLAKAGKVDGYFPEYFSEDVKSYATFSDPFPGGPLGFFKLKSSDISYQSLEDLKGHKIGTVAGYVNTTEFDNAAFLKKEPARDDMTNLKKLVAGRVDLIVGDKFVGMELIKTHMPDQADKIEFISKPLEEKDLYICISNKNKNVAGLIKAFNDGLGQMKADGTIKKILTKHGF